MQAQDYAGAKWGLAQRMHATSDAGLEAAFTRGDFIRTHILRPTWHFVAPEDLRWLLSLTGARVHRANAAQYRRMELDNKILRKTRIIISAALQGGHQLTRAEIGQRLAQKGISATGQRITYIMMHAELEGLVCSGAVRGKQHTYALVDERVPRMRQVEGDEALALLALRYFTSHGPATAHDFAWWSGLTVTEARRALALLDGQLESYIVEARTYWWSGQGAAPFRKPIMHLLPNYDEHVVAYRDHGPSLDPRAPTALQGWGNALTTHLTVLNGLVVGGWRRSRTDAHVELKLLVELRAAERKALQHEVARYRDFLA
jgi:hypothetical protein